MSRLSIFAAAAVLSALATTPVVFAKAHQRVRSAPQYTDGRTHGRAIPDYVYAGPRPPAPYDDTPSYDDPSKFGGGEALPITH